MNREYKINFGITDIGFSINKGEFAVVVNEVR